MIIKIVDDHSHYGCGNYYATIAPFFCRWLPWRRRTLYNRIAAADLLLIVANPDLELWQIHNSGKSQQSRLRFHQIQCASSDLAMQLFQNFPSLRLLLNIARYKCI